MSELLELIQCYYVPQCMNAICSIQLNWLQLARIAHNKAEIDVHQSFCIHYGLSFSWSNSMLTLISITSAVTHRSHTVRWSVEFVSVHCTEGIVFSVVDNNGWNQVIGGYFLCCASFWEKKKHNFMLLNYFYHSAILTETLIGWKINVNPKYFIAYVCM